MNQDKNHTTINGFRCHRQKGNWATTHVITLANIEAQILLREGLLVKFLREDDSQSLKEWWDDRGVPRLGYSWEQRLPDKATLDAFHKRMQRDVPGLHYIIIGKDRTIVNSEALAKSIKTVAKGLSMGRLRNSATKPPTTGQRMQDTVLGLRRLGSDLELEAPRIDFSKCGQIGPALSTEERDHA